MSAIEQLSMLPEEQAIRKWAVEYMAASGMSQTDLARALGYNNSSGLNQFLMGTYKSPKTFVLKLTEYRSTIEAAKDLHQRPDYLPTSISEDIYATIRAVHLKGGLAVECGDPGIGKSKACRKYHADFRNSATLVTVNPSFATKKNFFKLLCRTLKLPEGPVDEMWYNCAAFFTGAPKVLIIDEAQHLPAKVIDHIRSLADQVETLGIVFVGNRRLSEFMSGRHESDFAQLISRTKVRRMRTTTQIKQSDVQLLFPDVDGHALGFLHAVAMSKQGLRGATNLYADAKDNGNITFEGLKAMAKHNQMQV